MAEKSHSAETRTRSAEPTFWPERVSFAVSRRSDAKAAEAAADATSRAAVKNFFGQPTKVRIPKLKAALHFFSLHVSLHVHGDSCRPYWNELRSQRISIFRVRARQFSHSLPEATQYNSRALPRSQLRGSRSNCAARNSRRTRALHDRNRQLPC